MVAALRDRGLRDLRRSFTTPSIFTIGVVLLAVALLLGWVFWVVALALLVPITLALIQRPQRGILLFAAVLPFDGMIKALGPGWADPWKQVVVLALLFLTFVCPKSARAPRGRRLPGWLGAFGALFALGLASTLFVDRTTALVGLRISYFSALIGLIIWLCPLSRRERDHLVSIFLGMAIFTSVVGMWQQVVGHAYLNDLGWKYEDNIRFTSGLTLRSFSTFNLPFSFGLYLMLAILIVAPMALAEPRRLRSKIFFLSLPLLSLALLFTFVRGAMLGLAIGLLYLAFHRYKILVYGIPLVLVAALFIPTGAVLTNAVFGASSLGDRTTSWQDRFGQILDHPLGTGIGTTGAAADRAATLKNTSTAVVFQPDNSYLKVTFELGVIGLWFLILLLVSMFLFTRKVERRCEGIDRDFVAGVSAQWLAIIAASLVATYLELVPMDQLFWIMIMAVAMIAPDQQAGPAVQSGPDALDSGNRSTNGSPTGDANGSSLGGSTRGGAGAGGFPAFGSPYPGPGYEGPATTSR